MVKIARERPMALVSRSGRWLIGGALLLSLAVLAWALQGDTAVAPTRPVYRPAPARRSVRRTTPARTEATVEELAARPPSAGDYGPLLQGNVFQPRVIARQGRGTARGAASGHPAAAQPAKTGGKGEAPAPLDAWHDWKFTGIAQLDQQTYGLMDQPEKKQSRFVKGGDALEDATVARVAENEVALRAADGSLVRMKRVDPAADLLRSARPATPPSTVIPAPGSVTTAPTGQLTPQAPPAGLTPADDASQGGRRSRRGRRSQQLDGAGSAGGQ